MRIKRSVLLLMAGSLLLAACGSQSVGRVENLALYQPGMASQSFVSAPPWLSFDGETGSGWSPQANLPQWLQVDLGSPATIYSVRLLVNQDVSGRSVHILWVGGSADDLRQVQRFDQVTSTGDWLVFTPPSPLKNIRYVRIESVEGTDWVGWLEMQVLGAR